MSARNPWPQETRDAVADLVADGMTIKAAAQRYGVPYTTAHAWFWDPDGSRLLARKRSYDSACIDCGKPVSGSEGPLAHRCHACAAAVAGERSKVWTRDAIIDSIQEWADRYGEPPAIPDWSPTHARVLGDEDRARRFVDVAPRWPWFTTVVRVFGSWNCGIAAAGFVPRRPYGTVESVRRRRVA